MFEGDEIMFVQRSGGAAPGVDLTGPENGQVSAVQRTFFPETWLWDLARR